LLGGMMVNRLDIPHLRKFGRSFRSTLRSMRLVSQYALQRLRAPRGTTLHLGNALAARLYASLLARNIDIWFGASVEHLLVEDDAVRGVGIADSSGPRPIVARKGVVLATGGFEWDDEVAHQSDRTERYVAALETLRVRGLTFECSCSRSELADEDRYPGHCRERPLLPGRPTATRLRVDPGFIQFTDRIQGRFRQDVAAAVNRAPAGQVINASEEQVRDLLADFRQATYQAALQLRTDAAQAAFSPSAPPADSNALAEQGPR